MPALAQLGQPRVRAELVAAEQGITPGGTVHVALRQVIEPGWHTYWRNPGDSGEATQITWTLPQGWRAGDIVWPAPKRLPVGPLMNYGYEGEVLLPVSLAAPASARPGDTARLSAEVLMLVCKDICIPQTASLALDLPIVAVSAGPHPGWGAAVTRTLADAPKRGSLKATYALQSRALKLAVTGTPLRGADITGAYFFPFEGSIIDHAKPQKAQAGAEGVTLTLEPAEGFPAAAPPAAISGVLSLAGGRTYEISAPRGALPAGAVANAGAALKAGGGLGLPLALVFAFLGGVVLNAMPCVFPILSMKAASLAGHAHEAAAARRQGLAFTGGVLAAFAALALALLAAKAAGAAAGWGFQLQNPYVVAALALLMLLIALNLSGVFEADLAPAGTGGSLAGRGGLAGAFFTGALAVVVAAPCTAPFMAGALGYALIQSGPTSVAVFLALGAGFAAPFLLLSFSPGLLRRLPRPGPWMDTLRKLLAFPMYGAAAWLLWVLTQQAGTTTMAAVLAAALAVALAAWLFGRGQRARARGGRLWPYAATAAAAALVAVEAAGAGVRLAAPDGSAVGNVSPSRGLVSEPWSPERVAALRAEGRPVLVNFTAAWCVTCQVNDQVALSRRSVGEAFVRTGAAYLKADWTRRDETIARELARHGRAGVPLYLVYPAGGQGEPRVLPQLLTEGAVVAALERAAGTRA
ncbi:MAG TPA: protein-disulfide reductase DsbD domain-containing protein [Caulobacteraceae bacterium]